MSGLAAVAVERGQWPASATYARQAADLAERLGNNLVLGHTLATLCTSELRQADQGGRPQLIYEALEHGRRSVEVLERIPPTDSLVFAHAYLTEVCLLMKRLPDAVTHYDQALNLAGVLGLHAIRDRVVEEMGSRVEAIRQARATA